MKNLLKNNQGFTLVELLIVVLLITVISIISSDMIISLTSTSAKIQNKISLEEEYSFLNAKLTKLIQDADSVVADTESGNPRLVIKYPLITYYLVYKQNNLFLRDTLSVSEELQISEAEIGKFETGSLPNIKMEVTGTNPSVVYISFRISKDFNNPRLKTEIKFEKRITLNKTYQE